MKISTNIHTLLSIICLTVISFSSCDKSNDWSSDERYNRLFRSNNLAVTPQTFEAEVIWNATPNTDYYIIEVIKTNLQMTNCKKALSSTEKTKALQAALTVSQD